MEAYLWPGHVVALQQSRSQGLIALSTVVALEGLEKVLEERVVLEPVISQMRGPLGSDQDGR
jgi:hypothetical protein